MLNKSPDFIVWGSAGHAMVLEEVISLRGGSIVALFDNDPSAKSIVANTPIYYKKNGFNFWIKNFAINKNLNVAIAIGGHRGADRLKLATYISDKTSFNFPVLSHPSASISKFAKIDIGSQILSNSLVATKVKIGKFCIINHGANVDHECILGDGVHVAPGAVLCGCVSVGENSMIGANATILPRVKIGKNVIIGAGSVVIRDVMDGSVYVGNPAKKIRSNHVRR